MFVIQTVRIFIKLIYSIISIKRPVLLNVLFGIQTVRISIKRTVYYIKSGKEILFSLGMGSSKSLKILAFLSQSANWEKNNNKSDFFKKAGIFKLLEDPIPT